MVYQDHLTKFVILNALKTKRAEEVASHLVRIFLTFGAPCLLHSDNGLEFVNAIINELKILWPELNIVHGKPRHSQSQGSVERANRDIEDMIATWLVDNKSSKWTDALPFIQFMKNRAYHSGIKQSPYKAMFGFDPRVGLTSANLPTDVIQTETEPQLSQEAEAVPQLSQEAEAVPQLSQEVETEPSLTNAPTSTSRILKARKRAAEALEHQAKRMKTRSDNKQKPITVGDCVTVPIPDVDKAKSDLRNIIAIVLEERDGLFRLGTKHGIINKISELDICQQKFLNLRDVPTSEILSVRTIATKQSTSGGQGFFKCTCKTKCTTRICICKKNNVLCNSKCHNSITCLNK
uniref:Integrase catalytic domain-containing protein n=1 Tax=Trichogramma kaykai TaxID=54128 RepID=A0ABD2VUG2_9HYME